MVTAMFLIELFAAFFMLLNILLILIGLALYFLCGKLWDFIIWIERWWK